MSSRASYQRLDDQSRHNDEDDEEEGRGGRGQEPQGGGGGIELAAFSRLVNPLLGGGGGGGGGYAALNQHSEHGTQSSSDPVAEQVDGSRLSLKIHCKERCYDLQVPASMTITLFKQELVRLTDIPTHRQRLIYSGKLLRPEDKTIDFFKIPNQAAIHLFPLPETTVLPTATAVPTATAADANSNNNTHTPMPSVLPRRQSTLNTPTTAHFDPTIQQYGREVKMWCSVLLLLSTFTLFNNFSYFTTTGKFGEGSLDVLVFVMDTVSGCIDVTYDLSLTSFCCVWE